MSIKVNNDTANGSVEIKSPNVAGDYVVTTPARTCTMAGEDIVIGVGQTWQDVIGSRVLGTTYTNSTGKPIMIRCSTNSSVAGTSVLTVNGVALESWYSVNGQPEIVAIVQNGGTYVLTYPPGGTVSIFKFSELR